MVADIRLLRGEPGAKITTDGARERALAYGFNAYLTEPFRRNELLETVERLLFNQVAQSGPEEGGVEEEIL